MRLTHKSLGDISHYKVHGYDKKQKIIIVPDNPSVNMVVHEYGHYLYDVTPTMKKINIPSTITHPDGSFTPVPYANDNDEFFAYHFAHHVDNPDFKWWHPKIKRSFMQMLSKIKR